MLSSLHVYLWLPVWLLLSVVAAVIAASAAQPAPSLPYRLWRVAYRFWAIRWLLSVSVLLVQCIVIKVIALLPCDDRYLGRQLQYCMYLLVCWFEWVHNAAMTIS